MTTTNAARAGGGRAYDLTGKIAVVSGGNGFRAGAQSGGGAAAGRQPRRCNG